MMANEFESDYRVTFSIITRVAIIANHFVIRVLFGIDFFKYSNIDEQRD